MKELIEQYMSIIIDVLGSGIGLGAFMFIFLGSSSLMAVFIVAMLNGLM